MSSASAYGIDGEKIELLKQFVQLCKFNYSVLDEDNFKFFKDWLVNDLKATIPGMSSKKSNGEASAEADEEKQPSYAEAAREQQTSKSDDDDDDSQSEDEEEIEELDIDMEGVIEGDNDPPQDMGDDDQESTEEQQDKAMELRGEAMCKLSEGNNDEAVTIFTQAIKLYNKSTVLFVKRATAYLKLSKPNAAMRDARKALEINPDSAAALKVLGKSLKLLGKWDEACSSFEEAQKIDYDDTIADVIKEIKPKATKIREHKMAVERRRKEREVKERVRRVKKAQKAQAKAKKEEEERQKRAGGGGMPNMFNFAGGMPNFAAGASAGGPEGMDGFDFEAFMKHAAASGAMPGGMPGETPDDTKPAEADDDEGPRVSEVPTDDLD